MFQSRRKLLNNIPPVSLALLFFLPHILQESLSFAGGDYKCHLWFINRLPWPHNSYCSSELWLVVSWGNNHCDIWCITCLEGSLTGTSHPFSQTIKVVSPLEHMTSPTTSFFHGLQYQMWICSCGAGLKSYCKAAGLTHGNKASTAKVDTFCWACACQYFSM